MPTEPHQPLPALNSHPIYSRLEKARAAAEQGAAENKDPNELSDEATVKFSPTKGYADQQVHNSAAGNSVNAFIRSVDCP